MMKEIFLALGSNLDDRKLQLQYALQSLQKNGINILKVSSLYETEPFGRILQPNFYNAVVHALTDFDPLSLLQLTQKIEIQIGRIKNIPWGPRLIDIDILFYANEFIALPGLNIPHSGIPERKFVLIPFTEIAPDFVHPFFQKTVRELLNECQDQSIVQKLV